MDDLEQWRSLATCENAEWWEYYTGNPNLLGLRSADGIWISTEHEPGGPCVPQGPIYSVSARALQTRVEVWTARLETLVPQVATALIGVVRDSPTGLPPRAP